MDLDGVRIIDIIKGEGGGDADAHNILAAPPKSGGELDHRSNHYYFFRHLFKAVLLFTLVTIACFVLFNQGAAGGGSPFQFLPTSFYNFTFSHASNYTTAPAGMEEVVGLEQLLKRAATPDKTVILSPLNEAWIEKDSIFDLFLESFRIGNQTAGLLKHLIVVALDQKAFDHCLGLHLNCYFLKTQQGVDFSGEAHFMSADYLKIVWRKIDFLRTVLETGYSFIFTDADIMWFRNPFQQFYSDSHFQVACDQFRGNPWDLNNAPNTGLMYVKSSNQTIQFYKYWYKSREIYPAKHDQDAFNMIKRDPVVREIGLQIKYLDTAYFGGFCQSSRNFDLLCTMHANCCAGLDNKIHDLKILLHDWKKYISAFTESHDNNISQSHPISWSVPQSCGPASFRSHTPWKKNGT